jgi:homoserine kinase
MKIYIAFGFPAFEGLGSSGVLGVASLNVLKKLIKVKNQVHVLRHLDMVEGSSFPSLEAIPHSFLSYREEGWRLVPLGEEFAKYF